MRNNKTFLFSIILATTNFVQAQEIHAPQPNSNSGRGQVIQIQSLDVVGATVFGLSVTKPVYSIFQLIEPTKVIPAQIGTEFGWVIKLKNNYKDLKFKTETINSDNEIISNTKITPRDGVIYKNYNFNKKYKKGTYSENVYANDELIKTFAFEVK